MTVFYHMKKFKIDVLFSVMAAFLALFIVGVITMSFVAPLFTRDDYTIYLLLIKTMIKTGTIYINPEIAFPYGGNYWLFPQPDVLQNLLIRSVGFFVENIFLTLGIYLTICFSITAISAYIATRMLNVGRWLSLAVALAFACSPFMVERAAVHPTFCFAVLIPWLLAFCVALFYQGARLAGPAVKIKVWHGVVLGVVAGSCGVYYAFFSAFFLSISCALLWLGKAPFSRIKPALAAILVIVAVINMWLLPNYIYLMMHGGALPKRDLFYQALYALRLPDLVVPDLPPFAEKYHQYVARVQGEGNYPVAGLWGIIGLFAGVIFCLRKSMRNAIARRGRYERRERMILTLSLFTLAAVLFAMPYGLGFVFNMLVDPTIRAQNRVSVFILYMVSLLAAVFAERWLRRAETTEARVGIQIVAAAVLALTISPQFFALPKMQDAVRAEWATTTASYARIRSVMNERNLNHIAQFPSYYFPEGPSSPAFGNSDHFIPYLLDDSPNRKWSFGSMYDQSLWRLLAVAYVSPPALLDAAMRCLGYDAALMEKRGMGEEEKRLLSEYMKAVGRDRILWEDQYRVLIDETGARQDKRVCEKLDATQFDAR